MAWVVDTSVLLDVHLNDPTFGARSADCLARHLRAGLVLCPVSFVELGPAFGGDVDLQRTFLQEVGVDWLEPWNWQDTETAHRLWTAHVLRRRTKTAAKPPVADIFIEAFTLRFQGLITRNDRDFAQAVTAVP